MQQRRIAFVGVRLVFMSFRLLATSASSRPSRAALFAIAVIALLALAAPARGEWRELGTYRVTAYCPCARCCGKSDGITADGTYAPASTERIVSAPREIPFGTWLNVDGVGLVTVHDRGGAIRGKRLELFFQTHDEALQWGVQQRKVLIWVEPVVPAGPS